MATEQHKKTAIFTEELIETFPAYSLQVYSANC